MIIFQNAVDKLNRFNNNPKDRPRESYHSVLTARAGHISLVNENGNVSVQHIRLVDWALRSYFMMNRGRKMGSEDDFIMRLENKLSVEPIRNILARLRNTGLMVPNLNDYRTDAEQLYESLSNRENGLSSDGSYFCVGATKIMHCLFPELFIMLDRNVGMAVGYRNGHYNNFGSYWKVLHICRNEIEEWKEVHGNTDSLLRLDEAPTTLPRIFDKCASIMGIP